MPLELWILLALVAAATVVAAVVRLRRKRVREAPVSESNVYPLW
jgi:hypothetical protein